MKVLNNDIENTIRCKECGSLIGYNRYDIEHGIQGMAYIKCPVCGEKSWLPDSDITITPSNITFPQHFTCHTDGVDISDEKINELIQDAIRDLQVHKDEDYYYCETGNLHVCAFRWDNDEVYHVVVTKDYYDCEVQYESIDCRGE